MPARTGTPSRVSFARRLALIGLATMALAAIPGPTGTSAGSRQRGPSRSSQLSFMWAMAGQESGWDYFARNRSSGAFGKYQIMPFNWPSWAEKYLGDRHADQTPANQERVAYGKLRDLHGWLGSWRRVAYWWLTGSDERDRKRWSSYASGYVENIQALRKRAPRNGGLPTRIADASLLERGDWRRAERALTLRLDPAGPTWRRRGEVGDGQIVRIRHMRREDGHRWLRVVTADGRLGWLKAIHTVPAHAPRQPRWWSDVRDDGHARRGGDRRRDDRPDRSKARPRPR